MEYEGRPRSRVVCRRAIIVAAATLFTAGCSRMEDTTANYTRSIDAYYASHPSCLWSESVKFPVEQDSSSTREVRAYDALVHEGLLVRSSAQKTLIDTASPKMDVYDLSDKGRGLWAADPQDAGSGDFCYGHRKVTNIDSSTPTTSKSGATTDVIYRYTITGAPAWATSPEMQMAFPGLGADLSGNQVGRVTLTDSRKGWQVLTAPWAHISDSDIYK